MNCDKFQDGGNPNPRKSNPIINKGEPIVMRGKSIGDWQQKHLLLP